MPRKHEHKSRRIVQACVDEVWAIDPFKLEQICGFLDLRANGYTPSAEEVQNVLAVNGRADDGDDQLQIVDGVAHLGLFGMMAPRMNLMMMFSGGTSTQQLASQLDQLSANEDVRTIVLEVDSPGGVVTGTEELRQTIVRLTQSKRVVAIARGMATSAAYYVSAAATEFLATPSSTIGSIGVYAIHREITKAAEDAGVTFRVFRAGELKAAGNPYEKLSEKFAKAMQDRIDGPYRQFLAAVSKDRDISIEQIEKTFGQGSSFLAQQALDRQMIDGVAMIEDVIRDERTTNRQGSVSVSLPVACEFQGTWYTSSISAGAPSGDGHCQVVSSKEDPDMDPKVKAALVAKGLIKPEASDEEADQALKSHFNGRTVADDPDAVVKALFEPDKLPEPKPEPEPHRTADDVQQAVIAERARVRDLKARGELLGMEDADIQVALDEGWSVDKALKIWTDKLAKERQPVQGRIEGGEATMDKLHSGALAVLANRCGVEMELPPHANEMQRMSMLDIGRAFIQGNGGRIRHDPEIDAMEFLKCGGTDSVILGADGPSLNRAGDFPNLMSVLAGKILDSGFDMAEVTYPTWCARMSDAADFKPRTIIAAGMFDNLDLLMDDEMPKQLSMSEELMQWIQVDRYANRVGLTPVMVANDDLDAFTTQLQSLAFAHEAKLNALCVQQVATNPTMPDGTALFAGQTSDHYNLQSSGAAISSTSLAAHRTMHRLQPGVGTTKRIKTPPRILLTPPNNEEDALQALAPLASLEPKAPAADANVNTVRGTMRIVIENDFHDHAAYAWYTLADPMMRRCIVYCFQRGYGRGGQRETWFENGKKTRWVALEGRFAAVAASWRGIVKNPYTG